MRLSIERYIIVRNEGAEVRVPITNCFWCGPDPQAICGGCHEKANDVRRAMSAAERGAKP